MNSGLVHSGLMAAALFGKFHSMDWNDEKSVEITFANGMDFVEGFVEQFASDNNLPDTKTCVMDAEHLAPDVEKLVKDAVAGNKLAIAMDLAKLGTEVPKDVQDCLAVGSSNEL